MDKLSINVPVVYMGRDIWIWKGGGIHKEGCLKGCEIETFLGPEMAMSAAG